MHFASFGHIIQDNKLVNSLLPEVLFYHVKRQENNVAHELARKAISSDLLLAWMEFVSPNLYDVYNNYLCFFPFGDIYRLLWIIPILIDLRSSIIK